MYEVRPALCLDLDKTIRFNKDDPEGFINRVEDVALYDDVEAVLWSWKDRGYLILGITNQGGVAHGHKTVEGAKRENVYTRSLFERDPFDEIEAAFLMKGGVVEPFGLRSLLRKPSVGMLAVLEAKMFDRGVIVDWDNSLIVGDAWADEKLAENARVPYRNAAEFFGRGRDG